MKINITLNAKILKLRCSGLIQYAKQTFSFFNKTRAASENLNNFGTNFVGNQIQFLLGIRKIFTIIKYQLYRKIHSRDIGKKGDPPILGKIGSKLKPWHTVVK